jgi:hypothetical protein
VANAAVATESLLSPTSLASSTLPQIYGKFRTTYPHLDESIHPWPAGRGFDAAIPPSSALVVENSNNLRHFAVLANISVENSHVEGGLDTLWEV